MRYAELQRMKMKRELPNHHRLRYVKNRNHYQFTRVYITLSFPFHPTLTRLILNKPPKPSIHHLAAVNRPSPPRSHFISAISLIKSKHKLHLLILLISIDPQRRLQQIQLFLQTLRLLPHAPNPALHTADNLIDLLLLFPW